MVFLGNGSSLILGLSCSLFKQPLTSCKIIPTPVSYSIFRRITTITFNLFHLESMLETR